MSVSNAEAGESGVNTKNIITNTTPAMNSTSGYCHDILLLQDLHAPLCAKKLNSGTSSNQPRVLPQDIHFDLPPMPIPELNLSATTFKKLPTMVPNMNDVMRENVSKVF
jgi:hypothetical protein